MKINLFGFFRFLLYPFFKVLYNPKIIGKENILKNGSIILASNHKHAMDPLMLAIATKRPIHFLAKKEIFIGPLKYFFLSVGLIPVDRGHDNTKAVSKAEEYLKEKEVIGIFPEGTRNKIDDKILPFKTGAVRFAYNTNSYIVPIYINGKYKFFGNKLVIKVGKPYKVKTDDIKNETDKLRDKIIKLKKDCE